MKFWIRTEQGDTYESFNTSGHCDTAVSSHLDAVKIAFAWGYSVSNGFYLHTEDGVVHNIVDPYQVAPWKNQIDHEVSQSH